jgi:hypothetical protein
MRSRHVSSASKIPDCVVAHQSDRCSSSVRPVPTGLTSQIHRSDRSGAAAAPSSVLRSWLCGSTKEPSRFLVNHTWRPHWRRPFALVLHLHQHQSSRILHLQYLAKNKSTQRCQSLITQGSDHPPVLEPHMVLNLPLDECMRTPT